MNTFNPVNFSKEFRFLIYCIQSDVDPNKLEKLRQLIDEEIDWEKLLRLTRRHRLIPLVYITMKDHFSNVLSKAAMDTFRQLYQANIFCNMKLTAELVKIVSLLQENNIPVISFKGPILALTLYGGLENRNASSDLDLLLEPDYVCKTIQVLEMLGYRSPPTNEIDFLKFPELTNEFLNSTNEISLQGNVTIDLHWNLGDSIFSENIDKEKLWNESEQTINGYRVKTIL